MADVVTETNVVQVTLLDAAGYVRTINLDNPKTGLTLNQIRQAFQPAIAGQWLYGRSDLVVEVQKANYSTATKIPIGGGEVTVTPNAGNIVDGASNPSTFSVEGAKPTAAMIVNSNVRNTSTGVQGDWNWTNPIVNDYSVTISGVPFGQSITATATYVGTATLQIWFGNNKVDIPITVNITVKM